MSRVDAPEGAVPHGREKPLRFVPSAEWVAAHRPENIRREASTARRQRARPFMPDVVLVGRDGCPVDEGDEVLVVPCSKRHRGYPIHTATADYYVCFMKDDGENWRAVAQCSYKEGNPPPQAEPGYESDDDERYDDERDWLSLNWLLWARRRPRIAHGLFAASPAFRCSGVVTTGKMCFSG